ncbi:hypothetical protein OG949_33095 [Streptomyces scopuliridis]|uniref:hypothetical protein n=1 Tax=Streptomyces scopuliridis TaxID=452529 RepID=UPI002DD8F3D2|nr:hypothetical protein [Streptomyces scopuliridis]WSB37205.1 hypothetical protein OG949_33095 [Streptomyces scopuliridis]
MDPYIYWATVMALAWLIGQSYYPWMLHTQPADPPPDAPERDPDWCHTHGKHRDDEEE